MQKIVVIIKYQQNAHIIYKFIVAVQKITFFSYYELKFTCKIYLYRCNLIPVAIKYY